MRAEREIARIQQSGVTAGELARASAQLVASEVFKKDSVFAQAMEIGQLEAVGLPYQQSTRLLSKLNEVTAAEVQAVAKKYFQDDTLTVAVLDPQALPSQPRAAALPTRH